MKQEALTTTQSLTRNHYNCADGGGRQ